MIREAYIPNKVAMFHVQHYPRLFRGKIYIEIDRRKEMIKHANQYEANRVFKERFKWTNGI